MRNKAIVTIPKQVTGGDELVVIPRQEYEELQHYRTEMKETLNSIARGEQEYRDGKTHTTTSLGEPAAAE